MAEAIREEVARWLQRDVEDARLSGTLVTVTGVEVTRDLRQAKVFVTIMGDEAQRAGVMEALAELAPSLRGPVGRALRLRSAPEFVFRTDTSVAYAARIESLLSQLNKPAPGAGDDTDD
ncbi:MAG: 30S ribosome-binding factor RbfA [Gemmatimonadaceae bacterium]|nr:30S ribosome-binding factor RbfA [Gemmatimonadaceae bacterium]